MSFLIVAIPISLLLGLGFLVAFLWSVETGQLDDLDKHSRTLLEDENRKEKDE